jgi:hypothetical protein
MTFTGLFIDDQETEAVYAETLSQAIRATKINKFIR